MSSNIKLRKLIVASMLLALALVLPFLTGQIPQIGNALCPMHIPVLLCGFFCGPWYALVVGFFAPLFRFMLFSTPPLMPTGIAMAFELCTYGFVSGMLYKILPRKKPFVYVSLIGAMLSGRAVWGIARVVLYGVGKSDFGWTAFMSGAFINAIPGICIQLIVLPVLVIAVDRRSTDFDS